MNIATSYPSLADKGVLVTGGATGIGAAMVEAFARQGARTTFIDIDRVSAEQLCQRVVDAGGDRPHYLAVDVTDVVALQRAVAELSQLCGGVSILVNNVANDMRHEASDFNLEDWRQCMAVNLDAAFFAAQTAYPAMQAAGGGAIINVSSINAILGPSRMVGYVTAKEALLGMTKALASDFGESNVRVNAILPGWVVTERQLATWLTPQAEQQWMQQVRIKRRLLPEDIANLALFLAADDSAMITGQQFVIDGGRT